MLCVVMKYNPNTIFGIIRLNFDQTRIFKRPNLGTKGVKMDPVGIFGPLH